jgi:hypothetical protein
MLLPSVDRLHVILGDRDVHEGIDGTNDP